MAIIAQYKPEGKQSPRLFHLCSLCYLVFHRESIFNRSVCWYRFIVRRCQVLGKWNQSAMFENSEKVLFKKKKKERI